MSPLVAALLSLVAAALLIVVLGVRLTRLADRIAESTGMSRGFVGLLLLAVATSLPELVSSLTAVRYFGAPGLAFGNVFGSNVANMAFLALVDVLVVGSIFTQATRGDVRTAAFGVVLSALSLVVIQLSRGGLDAELYGHLYGLSAGIGTIALYLVAVRVGYEPEAPREKPVARPEAVPWRQFALCAAGVVLVSFWLTDACSRLADASGLGTTFVGALVLALATSLPELVVSAEAVRIGSPAMAIGNLVGSNLFNLVILSLCALTAPAGSFYALPEAATSLPAAWASLAMMCVVVSGCWSRSRSAVLGRFSPLSMILAAMYVASNLLVYGR